MQGQHQQNIDLANLSAAITQQGVDAQGLMTILQDHGSKITSLADAVTNMSVNFEAVMTQVAAMHKTMLEHQQ